MLRTSVLAATVIFLSLAWSYPSFAQSESSADQQISVNKESQQNLVQQAQDKAFFKAGDAEGEFSSLQVDAQKEFEGLQVDAQKEFEGLQVDAQKEFPNLQVDTKKEFPNT